MSWEEIKMSVNSDVQTPLNEKMKYIGGIVPRNEIKKVTVLADKTNETDTVLLSVTGKGFVTGLSAIANRSEFPDYRPTTIKIYLDQGTSTQKIITFSQRENQTATLLVDVNSLAPDATIKTGTNVFENVGVVINDPNQLRFDKSLKVSAIRTGFAYRDSELGRVYYTLV